MNIHQITINELQGLSNQELMIIYDMVRDLKERKVKTNERTSLIAPYLKVKEALKNLKGNLSDMIINDRDDRV
jgi:hypothetical protein